VIVSKAAEPASQLINQWFRAGTAAGLEGVFYDNRDRKHSDLGIATYPQLEPLTYTAEEREKKLDWGRQLRAYPGKVIVGNSSTASPANQAGSHQRMYYLHPKGLSFLYQQYRFNALYVYPEHRDHDPGSNGPDGYGDLYPANSPYLISSQGSSGSDRAFMYAVLKTIAAFSPETRETLIKNGLLMPTVQAIFRRSNRQEERAADYFSGTAHPSAFDGKLIDEEAMVKRAHAMTVAAIPPLAQLEILQGPPDLKTNIDFFEPEQWGITDELLGASPCSIAWVFRGPEYRRVVRLSAKSSVDLEQRKLRYRWVVLRGDSKLITIETAGDNDAEATISVAYHARRPISPGSLLGSNRVDIGLFAIAETDGKEVVSAPAFVSFTSLPNEHRSYSEDGRLVEIFYGARTQALGFPLIDDPRWDGLLAQFENKEKSALSDPGVRLIQDALEDEQIASLRVAAEATTQTRADIAMAQSRLDVIEAGLQKTVDRANAIRLKANADHKKQATAATEAAVDQANRDHNDAKRAMREGDGGAAELKQVIAGHRAKVVAALRDNGVPEIIRSTLISLRDDPRFFSKNADRFQMMTEGASNQGAAKALAAAQGRLADVGVVETENPPENERYHLRQFHLDLLSDIVVPGFLQRPPRLNYADPRLTTAKRWRDVYRYQEDGSLAGWTRFRHGESSEYNAEGKRIEDAGVVEVRYVFDPKTKQIEIETAP
jgi:hypothetical protein